MTEREHQLALEAKETLKPKMERQTGTFQCVLCGHRQKVDGNCPNDDLPLRRLPESEI